MNIEEAKANGWVREDQLPTITTREYNLWCSNSQIIDGVRMGPCLREILPTDLKNIKLSLDNAGESFIETSREDRKFQYVKGEDYSFIEDAQLGIGGVSISALTASV